MLIQHDIAGWRQTHIAMCFTRRHLPCQANAPSIKSTLGSSLQPQCHVHAFAVVAVAPESSQYWLRLEEDAQRSGQNILAASCLLSQWGRTQLSRQGFPEENRRMIRAQYITFAKH